MNRSLCIFLSAFLALGAGCSNEQGDVQASASPQEKSPGEALYTRNCKVCHAQALNGAPILGNKQMWETRAKQGKEVLVNHAMDGFGLMPAKGGKADLTEQDISAVVDYMLAKIE